MLKNHDYLYIFYIALRTAGLTKSYFGVSQIHPERIQLEELLPLNDSAILPIRNAVKLLDHRRPLLPPIKGSRHFVIVHIRMNG